MVLEKKHSKNVDGQRVTRQQTADVFSSGEQKKNYEDLVQTCF